MDICSELKNIIQKYDLLQKAYDNAVKMMEDYISDPDTYDEAHSFGIDSSETISISLNKYYLGVRSINTEYENAYIGINYAYYNNGRYTGYYELWFDCNDPKKIVDDWFVMDGYRNNRQKDL